MLYRMAIDMTQYLYPQNLRATANLWLWSLKDFCILGIAALLSIVILVQTRIVIPVAVTLCYGFLTIRMDETTVSVLLWTDTEGKSIPFRIRFEDDHIYENVVYNINRVTDVRRAASTKVGDTGIRYTIFINGKEMYLFEDENRWFIEARDL